MTDFPEWQISCPWCHAAPGTRCHTPRGRRIAIPSHDARIQAWTTATTRQRDQTTGETE